MKHLKGLTRSEKYGKMMAIVEGMRGAGYARTYKQVEQKIGTCRNLWEKGEWAHINLYAKPKYTDFLRLEGDWLITSDWHIPCFDPEMVDHAFKMAKVFGIRQILIAGDFLDEEALSVFVNFTGKGATRFDDELITAEICLKYLLDNFDKIVFLAGNHDWRLMRITNGQVPFYRLLKMMGAELDYEGGKIVASRYPYCHIGESWRVTHPKSYSVITARVATSLAEKYHRNVLSAHGHHFGFVFDRSGKYLAGDTGGFMDLERTGYLMFSDTRHPVWNSGFWILKDGYPYPFSEFTDWPLWEERVTIKPKKEVKNET